MKRIDAPTIAKATCYYLTSSTSAGLNPFFRALAFTAILRSYLPISSPN